MWISGIMNERFPRPLKDLISPVERHTSEYSSNIPSSAKEMAETASGFSVMVRFEVENDAFQRGSDYSSLSGPA